AAPAARPAGRRPRPHRGPRTGRGGARTGEGGSIVAATGLFPFLVADLARRATAEAPLVIVTATTRAAEDLRAALSALVGTAHLVELPAWETLPHERLSPRADTVARRLSTLW